jgi:hypothetical protein
VEVKVEIGVCVGKNIKVVFFTCPELHPDINKMMIAKQIRKDNLISITPLLLNDKRLSLLLFEKFVVVNLPNDPELASKTKDQNHE